MLNLDKLPDKNDNNNMFVKQWHARKISLYLCNIIVTCIYACSPIDIELTEPRPHMACPSELINLIYAFTLVAWCNVVFKCSVAIVTEQGLRLTSVMQLKLMAG